MSSRMNYSKLKYRGGKELVPANGNHFHRNCSDKTVSTLSFLRSNWVRLTEWERTFLSSIETGIGKYGSATPKQMTVVYKIRKAIVSGSRGAL